MSDRRAGEKAVSIYVDAFVDLVRKHQKPAMSVADIGCFDGSGKRTQIPMYTNPTKTLEKILKETLQVLIVLQDN